MHADIIYRHRARLWVGSFLGWFTHCTICSKRLVSRNFVSLHLRVPTTCYIARKESHKSFTGVFKRKANVDPQKQCLFQYSSFLSKLKLATNPERVQSEICENHFFNWIRHHILQNWFFCWLCSSFSWFKTRLFCCRSNFGATMTGRLFFKASCEFMLRPRTIFAKQVTLKN